MRLGGWLRLWVVLAVLWAIPVALLGYHKRPNVDDIKRYWYYEATNKMAERISEHEGRDIQGYQLRDRLKEKYPSDDQQIAWLEKVPTKPKLSQVVFVEDVKAINAKYRAQIASLPSELRHHAFNAFLFWLVPMLFLLGLGYGVAWVRRGFREPKNG